MTTTTVIRGPKTVTVSERDASAAPPGPLKAKAKPVLDGYDREMRRQRMAAKKLAKQQRRLMQSVEESRNWTRWLREQRRAEFDAYLVKSRAEAQGEAAVRHAAGLPPRLPDWQVAKLAGVPVMRAAGDRGPELTAAEDVAPEPRPRTAAQKRRDDQGARYGYVPGTGWTAQ